MSEANVVSPTTEGGEVERIVSFDRGDVLTVARAMTDVENCIKYDDYSNSYECIYCAEKAWESNSVKHSTDCPVLIAQDLLT